MRTGGVAAAKDGGVGAVGAGVAGAGEPGAGDASPADVDAVRAYAKLMAGASGAGGFCATIACPSRVVSIRSSVLHLSHVQVNDLSWCLHTSGRVTR